MIVTNSNRSHITVNRVSGYGKEVGRVSSAETEFIAHASDRHGECDACPNCMDTCYQCCAICSEKSSLQTAGPPGCIEIPRHKDVATYTMCQVKRHNSAESAWIVAGQDIYDITSYLDIHPGGAMSLLRRAGGAKDCTEDLKFHSRRGQRKWDEFKIGRLVECGSGDQRRAKPAPWFLFWNQ
mmetsp:Transcript_33787/g.70233  ORF Transcript_33787/g.70233 Transcript_33787/m.70233 type:complete len:182 (+) Transcript_33787:108-653(+)